jgi:hypothetical protein
MAEPRTINDPSDNSAARVISGALQVSITSGNIAASNPSVAPTGAAVPGNATAIGFQNAGGNLTIPSAANPLPVSFAASGNTTVIGPTAVGSPAANPPVLIAGTGNAAATGLVQVLKVDSGGNISDNLAQVGGAAITLGNNTAANSLPVVIATNQGSVPVTPTANSTVNLTQVSGTTVTAGNSTAANSLSVVIATNQAAIPVTVPANITANVTAMVANITANVTGPVAGNSTVGGNPVQTGYRAVTAETVPNGNNTVIQPVTDAVGKTINQPYANKENMLRGNCTVANTTAVAITGLGAQGAAFKIYITSIQAFRTDAGATLVYVTINDTGNTTVPLPPNGGAAVNYPVPLVLAANTAANITLSANVTSVLVSAQGYFGA